MVFIKSGDWIIQYQKKLSYAVVFIKSGEIIFITYQKKAFLCNGFH